MEKNFNALSITSSAEKAEQDVIRILKTAGMQEQCYAYKTRVKSWEKLLEKVERKREKKEYCLNDVTDVVGLRVVTLYRQDMVQVVETILSLISHSESFNPNPFRKKSLEEAIIYTPDPSSDAVINNIEKRIIYSGLLNKNQIIKTASAARYSSIHLVARLDACVKDFDENYEIPIEIQVRTVFEDAWGEVDHRYNYQSKEGKSDIDIKNPLSVSQNILTLKKFVDSCAEYADNIKYLATEDLGYTPTVKALDTDDVVEQNLRHVSVPNEMIQQYMGIREMRAEAENSSDSAAKQLYLTAAENFNSFLEQVKKSYKLKNNEALRTLTYHVKIDEALCRLSIGDEMETDKAIAIYKNLSKVYHAYPIIKYRLAQALIRTGEYDEARKELKKSQKTLKRLESVGEDKRRSRLPDIEMKRLKAGIPKLLGLAYWQEADEIFKTSKNSTKVLQFLEQAIERSQESLDSGENDEIAKVKVINNLIFYILEIVYFKKLKGPNGYKERLNALITELEDAVEIEESKNINQLDTLMNAYLYLKEASKAEKVAKRIEELSLEFSSRGKNIDPDILNRVYSLLKEDK